MSEAIPLRFSRRRVRHGPVSAVAVAGLCLVLAGCGAGGSKGGRFDAGTGAYPLPCLAHQAKLPGRAYTAQQDGDTAAIFTMLKYFTANKTVTAYCDGKDASETDRQWARLYVDLGSEPANVAHILG